MLSDVLFRVPGDLIPAGMNSGVSAGSCEHQPFCSQFPDGPGRQSRLPEVGAMHTRQEHSIRLQDSAQLGQPEILPILVEMREYRSAPDQVKGLVLKRAGRQCVVDDAPDLFDGLLTPANGPFVDVAPRYGQVGKLSALQSQAEPPSPAAEVQELPELGQ